MPVMPPNVQSQWPPTGTRSGCNGRVEILPNRPTAQRGGRFAAALWLGSPVNMLNRIQKLRVLGNNCLPLWPLIRANKIECAPQPTPKLAHSTHLALTARDL